MFTRDREKKNKHFHSVELGNDQYNNKNVIIYINIKRLFLMEIDYLITRK